MESKEFLNLLDKAKAGDTEAKKEIIDFNIPIIKKINSFYGRTEDGYQEGIIGLCRAIEKFDKKYNVKFSTYAYHHIKKRIKDNYNKEKYKTTIHFTRKINRGELEHKNIELINEVVEDEKQGFNYCEIENRIFIEDILNKHCSEKERYILHKIYFDGISEVEVAKSLGISKQAVNHTKLNAFKKIRKYI